MYKLQKVSTVQTVNNSHPINWRYLYSICYSFYRMLSTSLVKYQKAMQNFNVEECPHNKRQKKPQMLNKNRKFSDTGNIGHKTQNKDKQSKDTTHMKTR